jgi:AraC-like DNA-binding protein
MLDRPADLLVADAGIAGRSLTGTRRVDRCAQACLVCLAKAPRDAYKQTPPSTRHEEQPLANRIASPAAACAAQAKDRKRTTRGPPRPNSQIPSMASRGRESAPTPRFELLAETGLLKGREATIHWAFAPTFHRNFPDVRLRTEEVLIAHEDIVMTGGVMSWHDLALYLIARYVGPVAAQAMARMLMLEWHGAGQAPYIEFTPELGHGDGLVAERQRWLERHYMIANPVEEMTTGSGLSRRTLERRFRKATGRSPISYVQQLRIREARRLLERTTMPIDEIGFVVGYENTAFFRRLFQRTTRLPPGSYRRKFGVGQVR